MLRLYNQIKYYLLDNKRLESLLQLYNLLKTDKNDKKQQTLHMYTVHNKR